MSNSNSMIFIGRNPVPRYLVARREKKTTRWERRSKIFGSSKSVNCLVGDLMRVSAASGEAQKVPAKCPPKYNPVAPLLPLAHPNTTQLLRSCQLHTQIQASCSTLKYSLHPTNWYSLAFHGFMSECCDILAHERTPDWTPDMRKKIARKKWVVQIQIVVLNILYHYLVVLNVKIRNRFLGTLPALGTVRRSWKDELNRVKTSHPLWLDRSQKSSPQNSFLPGNSYFLDVSVNISWTRTS